MKDGERFHKITNTQAGAVDQQEKHRFWLLIAVEAIAGAVWMVILNMFTKWVIKRRND